MSAVVSVSAKHSHTNLEGNILYSDRPKTSVIQPNANRKVGGMCRFQYLIFYGKAELHFTILEILKTKFYLQPFTSETVVPVASRYDNTLKWTLVLGVVRSQLQHKQHRRVCIDLY